jgi:hypothetical protein
MSASSGGSAPHDTAAKKALFSLNNDQVNSLNVGNVYVAGNYLYMRKEPDNPVIDYDTSKTVSSGWKIRPEVKLPEGWVVIQPGGDATNSQPDPVPRARHQRRLRRPLVLTAKVVVSGRSALPPSGGSAEISR